MSIRPSLWNWEDMPITGHDREPDAIGTWEASPLPSTSTPLDPMVAVGEWLSQIKEPDGFRNPSLPEFSSSTDINPISSHYLQDLSLSLSPQDLQLNSKKRKRIAEPDGSSISSLTKQPHYSLHGAEPAFTPSEFSDYPVSRLGDGVHSSIRDSNMAHLERHHHEADKDSRMYLDDLITKSEPPIIGRGTNQDSTSYLCNPMIQSNQNFFGGNSNEGNMNHLVGHEPNSQNRLKNLQGTNINDGGKQTTNQKYSERFKEKMKRQVHMELLNIK
ncbi:hypothetical protein PCANC_06962 [Puccinia coronata f. sp. avenae]|uniref:Uncharacterized protein n=1 Tax=Puccinia coronata f. sp. avenae TaxID=200324 RepID=A0A2N5VKT6_9BASI|nr:hypothetical protein PCANC_06962 [Puccinia coronata f. sp. avenae]